LQAPKKWAMIYGGKVKKLNGEKLRWQTYYEPSFETIAAYSNIIDFKLK
jgi:hypothetical protein